MQRASFFSIREPYFISLIQHIEDIFITCRSTGTRIKYTISGKEKLSAVIKSSFHFDETWKWDKMVHGAVLEKISQGLKKKSGDSYSWNWNMKKITLSKRKNGAVEEYSRRVSFIGNVQILFLSLNVENLHSGLWTLIFNVASKIFLDKWVVCLCILISQSAG